MRIITFLSTVLVSLILGASIIASGQLFLAIREIALNTRKENDGNKHKYGVLETVAKINNFLGWVVIAVGLILAALLSSGMSGFNRYPM